jgi:hypothetical protein
MDAEAMALLTGLLGTVLATLLIGGAMFGAWMLGRQRRRDAGDASGELGQRLARLEATLDRLSGDMERLAESQQFTMRLLGQRGEKEPVPEPRDSR